MIKAVLFDVDGTLIDSVVAHARAWQDVFAEYHHEVSLEAVRHQIGKGGDQLMPVFLSKEEIERDGEEIERRRLEIFQRRYRPAVRAFLGARELLEKIKEDGRRIVLASSAKRDELEYYKELARVGDLVEDETSSDDAQRSKPFPDIFSAALARVRGVSATEALVVGDSPYDAQAARQIGLRAVGFLCGGFPEAELIQAGCMALYRDPADLLARYATSPLGPETLGTGADEA